MMCAAYKEELTRSAPAGKKSFKRWRTTNLLSFIIWRERFFQIFYKTSKATRYIQCPTVLLIGSIKRSVNEEGLLYLALGIGKIKSVIFWFPSSVIGNEA